MPQTERINLTRWSAWIKYAAALAIACQALGDRVPRALRALAAQYRGAGLDPDADGLEVLAEMIERGWKPDAAPLGERGHASWCISIGGQTGACDCGGDSEDEIAESDFKRKCGGKPRKERG